MIPRQICSCHMAKLIGQELLDKIKELGNVPREELARAAGYVKTKKDGTEAFLFKALYEATIAASTGVTLGSSAKGAAGRKLSYITSVSKGGSALLGKGYLALLGAEHGDELDIAVDAEAGTITLKLPPVLEAAEEPVAA